MSDLQTMEVGLVQADLRWQDPEGNRQRLADLMDAQPGCDLYVLPETFTTGFLGDAGSEAESMDGATVAWLRRQARSRAAAVCGSVAISDEQGWRRNRLMFMPPEGELSWYDKRHLFSYGGEGNRYTGGDRHGLVQWRGWRIDLQICYDLRFPVWCRNTRGFDLQIFVANWPSPRVDAWLALLKARAIENQAFVVGVNRTGTDGNDVPYPGCSAAFDGGGQRLAELGPREGSVRVGLERNELLRLRERFPFIEDSDRFSLD